MSPRSIPSSSERPLHLSLGQPHFPLPLLSNLYHYLCFLRPNENILIPKVASLSMEVDYEAELAVVIGKRCKNVKKEDALQYVPPISFPSDSISYDVIIIKVLGYTCANDVSARRWQGKKGGGQWCYAKSFDSFCPLGPHFPSLLISSTLLFQIKSLLNRTCPCESLSDPRSEQSAYPSRVEWERDAELEHSRHDIRCSLPHCLPLPIDDSPPWNRHHYRYFSIVNIFHFLVLE